MPKQTLRHDLIRFSLCCLKPNDRNYTLPPPQPVVVGISVASVLAPAATARADKTLTSGATYIGISSFQCADIASGFVTAR